MYPCCHLARKSRVVSVYIHGQGNMCFTWSRGEVIFFQMSTCIYVTTVRNVQYCVQLAFCYDSVPDFIIVDTFFHYSNQFKVQDNKGI